MTSSEYIFRKPEPHIFDIAVRKSGLNPGEIWYCGNDIAVDVRGAHNAGLLPVFYDDRSVPSKFHEKNDALMANVDFSYLRIEKWMDLAAYLK